MTFVVCDPKLASDFIDSLFNDICGEQDEQEVATEESNKLCSSNLSDDPVISDIVSKSKSRRFNCDLCGKTFKDNNHVTEHKDRMHSDPTPGVQTADKAAFIVDVATIRDLESKDEIKISAENRISSSRVPTWSRYTER